MNCPAVSLMAAVARNGVLGDGQRMPWHLPADLAHLKRVTAGHVVVMGRRTWDSLPPRFRPLPGRRNIVVTRQPQWRADGAEAAASLPGALALASDQARVFVLGGGELYAAALPLADEMWLTEIDADFEGSVHFPAWPREAFERVWHEAGPPDGLPYSFNRYRRRVTPGLTSGQSGPR